MYWSRFTQAFKQHVEASASTPPRQWARVGLYYPQLLKVAHIHTFLSLLLLLLLLHLLLLLRLLLTLRYLQSKFEYRLLDRFWISYSAFLMSLAVLHSTSLQQWKWGICIYILYYYLNVYSLIILSLSFYTYIYMCIYHNRSNCLFVFWPLSSLNTSMQSIIEKLSSLQRCLRW